MMKTAKMVRQSREPEISTVLSLTDRLSMAASAPNGIKKMRELILELAVRGKLVPQDLNDEPAKKVLETIRINRPKEKSEASRDAESIRGFVQVHSVPDSWKWVRLEEIGEIIGGGTPKTGIKEYFSIKGVPWVTPADLYKIEGKFISRGRRDISDLGLKASSAQLLPKGTVLFSSRAPIGYIAIAENPIATNQGFKSCVPYIIDMNEYIYYFLKSAAKQIADSASGTTFKEVSGKDVKNIPFPLPPLNEQKRIVAKVDQLMALCDRMETREADAEAAHETLVKALLGSLTQSQTAEEFQENWQIIAKNFNILFTTEASLDTLKQTILQLAVMGKLVPQDPKDEPVSELLKRIKAEKEKLIKAGKIKTEKSLPEIRDADKPYDLPKGWEWVYLNSISTLITDGAHHTPTYIQEGIPFLSVKDVSSGVIRFDDCRYISEQQHNELTKRCKPEYGDILLTKVGTTGIAVVVDTNKEFSLFVSIALIKFLNNTVNPFFLSKLINSPFVKKQSKEGTEGIGNKNLVLRKINAFILPIPPVAEQQRIVAKVDELMTLCDGLKDRTARFRSFHEHLATALVENSVAV